MYVAVKGGETAILNSWKRLAEVRRGDPAVPELTLAQIREQLGLAVDRVMSEGSLYDPELAALAIKQKHAIRHDLTANLMLEKAATVGSSHPSPVAGARQMVWSSKSSV